MNTSPSLIDRARQLVEANPAIGRGELARALGISKDAARHLKQRVLHAMPCQSENLSMIDEHRLKTENRNLRAKLESVLSKQVLNQKYQEFVSELAQIPRTTPEWTYIPKHSHAHSAMPVAHLSDTHFDEVVDPAQVNYVNAYNRKIAKARLRRFFEKTIVLCDEYLKGVDYGGIVMPVSGDLLSGNIHDELRETNECSILESTVYWTDELYAGIKMFAERFGRVHIPWVVGNHGRNTQKPRAKGGVRDNFDWMIGAMLKASFHRDGDSQVTFALSDAFDCYFKVYSTAYLQTHGSQFKGGSGISAELAPMMIGDARKRERQQAINQIYDVLLLGHWHRRICLPRVKVNASLKGYDEYSFDRNFKYQEPCQSFWLDTPERGITFEAPIYVKAEKEGWEDGSDRLAFRAA